MESTDSMMLIMLCVNLHLSMGIYFYRKWMCQLAKLQYFNLHAMFHVIITTSGPTLSVLLQFVLLPYKESRDALSLSLSLNPKESPRMGLNNIM